MPYRQPREDVVDQVRGGFGHMPGGAGRTETTALAGTLSLLWVVMVTSAENRGWPGDVALADLSGTGLPAPSLVRTAKIATIEARYPAHLGRVEPGVRAEVMARIAERLGVSL